MKAAKKRAGGGAKTARSETVTVRLDPKLRYLCEVAARVQRRTLSSFIEYVLADSLKRVDLGRPDGKPETVEAAGGTLWKTEKAARLDALRSHYPHLLTFDELNAD